MNCKHPYPDTCCCGARYTPVATVVFRGGQLGGEYQTIRREDMKGYRVPVLLPVQARYTEESGTISFPETRYRTDTYQFEGRMDGDFYVMQWVDPVPELERRIKELSSKIARAKDALSV